MHLTVTRHYQHDHQEKLRRPSSRLPHETKSPSSAFSSLPPICSQSIYRLIDYIDLFDISSRDTQADQLKQVPGHPHSRVISKICVRTFFSIRTLTLADAHHAMLYVYTAHTTFTRISYFDLNIPVSQITRSTAEVEI